MKTHFHPKNISTGVPFASTESCSAPLRDPRFAHVCGACFAAPPDEDAINSLPPKSPCPLVELVFVLWSLRQHAEGCLCCVMEAVHDFENFGGIFFV